VVKRTKKPGAEKFWKVFGVGEQYRPYSDEDDARLSGRIPSVMRQILKQDGWCSYKEQVLWLCDPDDWDAAARAWFPEAERPQVFARSAFGDLFVWDGELFRYVMVHDSLVMTSVPDGDWFFTRVLTAPDFAPQTHLPVAVRDARAKAGRLAWDEMYAYVPALALGGSEETSRIERVKALEALSMLSQLSPIKRL
jgi:hypothetical protein